MTPDEKSRLTAMHVAGSSYTEIRGIIYVRFRELSVYYEGDGDNSYRTSFREMKQEVLNFVAGDTINNEINIEKQAHISYEQNKRTTVFGLRVKSHSLQQHTYYTYKIGSLSVGKLKE